MTEPLDRSKQRMTGSEARPARSKAAPSGGMGRRHGAAGSLPGAPGANFQYATLFGENTSNLIQSNGHIAGLDLTAGASLVIRDYDGGFPIVVDQHLAMDATGTLRLEFDADPWDSKIYFAPGIPVALGGTLELTFAADVNLATQIGRTIDLFDWTGVTPTGAFTVSSPYTWNLSNLYTTGEITLLTAPNSPGDFNLDGTVDAADYIVWRKNPDGIYTQNDYNTWRTHFGQTLFTGSGAGAAGSASADPAIPEPSTSALVAAALLGLAELGRRTPRRGQLTRWIARTDRASQLRNAQFARSRRAVPISHDRW